MLYFKKTIMKYSQYFFALPLLASTALLHAAVPVKPNVIVLIADDLGSGDVSCLFRKVVKTPNIDRLAKMGVKFTSGYVPVALCGPSRAGFLTGQYPQRFGFGDNGGGIPTDIPLLPGVLKQAGYYTAHIGKWHSSGPMPFQRGCFDETLCSPVSSPFIDYYHPKLSRNGKIESSNEYSTDLFAREAEEFLERNKNKTFELTVAFNAPHILRVVKNAFILRKQYDSVAATGKHMVIPKVHTARPVDIEKFNAEFPGDSARADAVACIYALDQAVGRILNKLRQTGLDKNTIIFFFADNGAHIENRSENLPLRDYKWSVYEGGIRVPFFAVYPGVFPSGLEYKQPVSTLDIFSTCVALAGVEAPPTLEGVNLTPYIQGKIRKAPHDALYFSFQNLGAIRQDKWKLVMESDGSKHLYDLSKDIEELNDQALNQPLLVKELNAKWETWYSQMPVNKAKSIIIQN